VNLNRPLSTASAPFTGPTTRHSRQGASAVPEPAHLRRVLEDARLWSALAIRATYQQIPYASISSNHPRGHHRFCRTCGGSRCHAIGLIAQSDDAQTGAPWALLTSAPLGACGKTSRMALTKRLDTPTLTRHASFCPTTLQLQLLSGCTVNLTELDVGQVEMEHVLIWNKHRRQ
jgi:hypothetical protein